MLKTLELRLILQIFQVILRVLPTEIEFQSEE